MSVSPVPHRTVCLFGHQVGQHEGRQRHGTGQQLPDVHVQYVHRPQARQFAPSTGPCRWLRGKLQTGRTINFLGQSEDKRKMCSLYLSLMDRYGLKLDKFGDADTRLDQI